MEKYIDKRGLCPDKIEASMALGAIVREGARRLLMSALNVEIRAYLDRAAEQRFH